MVAGQPRDGRRRRWLTGTAVAIGFAAGLGLGVIAWGRVADTTSSAAVLTTGWFVGMLAVAAGLAARRRWLRLPLAAGYGVAAVATTLLVGLPSVLDRTVDDGDLVGVVAAPDAAAEPTRPGPGSPDPAGATAAPRAVELGRAELAGIDHDAAGTARLIRLADGTLLVRLEGLDVEPGPDYYVHLLAGPDRREPADGSQLARLRGNRGNQNYPVPAGHPVRTPATVLIWCRAFDTPIAAATVGAA